ncbi:hypothetical protein C8R43DRAFT_976025 [Mycena crocata]|nr:hypothetical protein C8R43DRAFT_976025 [Mycena crocata]
MSHISFVKLQQPETAGYKGPSSDEIRSNVRGAYFNVCSTCKKQPGQDAPVAQFKKCSRCLIARYCFKECQTTDWKTHKEACADSGSPTHIRLTKRLVANDSLMFEIQLVAILALDLLEHPANALENCLSVEVNTNMPADPLAHLKAMMNDQDLGRNELYVLHIASMKKESADAHAKLREDRDRLKAGLTAAGLGGWPVVMLVFTSNGATALEVPYLIDPQAMERVRNRTPFQIKSSLSGDVEIPLTEEDTREILNNNIRMDKTNRFLLRTKKSQN